MGERRGLKALELWCRRVTEGYRDVNVVDMSSSWRDGLAFCALIHHFRPDLIEFEALRKGDVLANNRLAFSVAESQLGIPALLDAEDMLAYREPDRLSVATYVSQFYQYFEGSLGSRRRASAAASALKRPAGSASSPAAAALSIGPPTKVCGLGDTSCHSCRNRVFLLERLIVDGRLYHRSCFRCSRCDAILNPGAYNECDNAPGTYECTVCPKDEGPEFILPKKVGEEASSPEHPITSTPAVAAPPKPEVPEKKLELTESVRVARKLFQSAMVADGVAHQPTSTTNGAAEYTPGSTPMRTPDTTPDMTPDATPQMTPSAMRKPTTAKPWETSNSGVTAAAADGAANNGSEDAKTKDVDSSRLDDTAARGTTGGDSAVAKWKSIQKPELPSFLRSRDEPKTTSTVRENIKRFSQVSADGASSTSPFRLRRSVRDEKENNAASPLRGSDRFFSSRLSSEKGAKLGGSATDLALSGGAASPEFRKQRSRQEEGSPGPESPTTERLSLKLRETKDQTSPGQSPSPRKASLDMPVIKSDISAQDLIPKPLPRTRTLKSGLTGSYSLSVMSSTFGSTDEVRGRAETDGALSESPPPLPSEPPPSLASDDRFPEEMSEKSKLPEDLPKLDREHAVVSRERSPAPKDIDSLSLSREPRDSISPNRTATSKAPPGPDGAVPESVSPTKPTIPAVQLPSEAQDPEPPDKDQSAYPTDLNPFGSDSEEEDEPEYPESLNPFNDDLEDDEEAAGSQAASSPARKSSLYDDSLNPFSEEDDERDISLSRTTSPSKRTPSQVPFSSRRSSGTGTPLSQRSLNTSPMLQRTPMALPLRPSPRARKKHAAPPPPPLQAKKSEGDVSARRDKSEKDEVNKSIRKSDQEASPTPSKNTFGYWKRKKRPAPSVPVPVRREIKRLPLKEIQSEMESITAKQEELERQGREIEMQIRDRNDAEPTVEEEEMIMQLFELVNEKNNLFRRQAELMYIKRSQRLEEEQVELEYQIRCIMTKPLNQKCEDDDKREQELLQRLLEVVEARNEIVDSQELDRRRVMQEDWSIQEQMTQRQNEIKDKMTAPEATPEKKHKKKDKHRKKDKLEKKEKAEKKADKHEEMGDEEKRKSLKKIFKQKLVLSTK